MFLLVGLGSKIEFPLHPADPAAGARYGTILKECATRSALRKLHQENSAHPHREPPVHTAATIPAEFWEACRYFEGYDSISREPYAVPIPFLHVPIRLKRQSPGIVAGL